MGEKRNIIDSKIVKHEIDLTNRLWYLSDNIRVHNDTGNASYTLFLYRAHRIKKCLYTLV